MKPSVRAASTRLCCEIIFHSVFTLTEPLSSASYCMLFCSIAVNAAWFYAVLSTHLYHRTIHWVSLKHQVYSKHSVCLRYAHRVRRCQATEHLRKTTEQVSTVKSIRSQRGAVNILLSSVVSLPTVSLYSRTLYCSEGSLPFPLSLVRICGKYLVHGVGNLFVSQKKRFVQNRPYPSSKAALGLTEPSPGQASQHWSHCKN